MKQRSTYLRITRNITILYTTNIYNKEETVIEIDAVSFFLCFALNYALSMLKYPFVYSVTFFNVPSFMNGTTSAVISSTLCKVISIPSSDFTTNSFGQAILSGLFASVFRIKKQGCASVEFQK